jgi:hypothetical protein
MNWPVFRGVRKFDTSSSLGVDRGVEDSDYRNYYPRNDTTHQASEHREHPKKASAYLPFVYLAEARKDPTKIRGKRIEGSSSATTTPLPLQIMV